MVLHVRNATLGELDRLDRVANHLSLRSSPEDDRFADDVIHAALKQIARIVTETNATSGEQIIAALAESLGVRFEAVRTPDDIARVRDHYVKRERQLGFAQLDEEMSDPKVDALLFQLTPGPQDGPNRYVAVLNLQNGSSREFWNKCHELAHRLIEPPQKFLLFKRHPSERTNPVERLVDAVAAEIAFYTPVFLPIIHQFDSAAPLTIDIVRSIQRLYAPSASFMCIANAAVKHWRLPAMLITAERRGRRRAPSVDVALRVEMQGRNPHAERVGLKVFSNMRVPEISPLFAAFRDRREVSEPEDLGAWTTSGGGQLPRLTVYTSAVRMGEHAYALLSA